jgi:hypothetical protein
MREASFAGKPTVPGLTVLSVTSCHIVGCIRLHSTLQQLEHVISTSAILSIDNLIPFVH